MERQADCNTITDQLKNKILLAISGSLYTALIIIFIAACGKKETAPIGYIGFSNGEDWYLAHNDCNVYSLEDALPYIWFNRDIFEIGCFPLEEEFNGENIKLKNRPIKIYAQPDSTAAYITIRKFKDVEKNPQSGSASKGQTGTFPKVYVRHKENWFKVEEGWVFLAPEDKGYVKYFDIKTWNERDSIRKARREYYLTH